METDDMVRELHAREEIETLRYAYAHHLDNGNWTTWGNLFAEDAHFTVYRPVPSDSRDSYDVEGRTSIIEFGESAIENTFEYSAHMMHNPLLRVDEETATGRWYFDVFNAQPDGHVNWHQGTYADEYTKTEEGWRFKSVVVTVSAELANGPTYELGYEESEQGEFPTVWFPA